MSVKYNNKITNSYHNSQLLSLIIQLAFFYYCMKNKKLQEIVFYDLIYNRGRQIASVYICVLAVISSSPNDNK